MIIRDQQKQAPATGQDDLDLSFMDEQKPANAGVQAVQAGDEEPLLDLSFMDKPQPEAGEAIEPRMDPLLEASKTLQITRGVEDSEGRPETPLERAAKSLQITRGIDSDKFARSRKAAKDLGINLLAYMAASPKAMDKLDTGGVDLRELSRKAPVLVHSLSDTQTAALARDDLLNLGRLERDIDVTSLAFARGDATPIPNLASPEETTTAMLRGITATCRVSPSGSPGTSTPVGWAWARAWPITWPVHWAARTASRPPT